MVGAFSFRAGEHCHGITSIIFVETASSDSGSLHHGLLVHSERIIGAIEEWMGLSTPSEAGLEADAYSLWSLPFCRSTNHGQTFTRSVNRRVSTGVTDKRNPVKS